jgi:hypothetical protein
MKAMSAVAGMEATFAQGAGGGCVIVTFTAEAATRPNATMRVKAKLDHGEISPAYFQRSTLPPIQRLIHPIPFSSSIRTYRQATTNLRFFLVATILCRLECVRAH